MIYVVKYQNRAFGQIDQELFESRSKKGAKKFRKRCGAILEREFGRETQQAMMPRLYIFQRLEEGDPGYVGGRLALNEGQATTPATPVGARLREAAARIQITGPAMNARIDGIATQTTTTTAAPGTWGTITRTNEPLFRATVPMTGGGNLLWARAAERLVGTGAGVGWYE